jgi:DNA polymerase III delta subunit
VPTLTLDALRERLTRGELGRLHLFVGSDVRLMDRMVDAVEATVPEADRPFAVERVHAGEPGGSPVDIVAAASNLPMLGDKRIVIVLRAERLLKPKRGGKASEEEEPDLDASGDPAAVLETGGLEAYVEAPASFSTVVFVASEVDRTRRLTKRLVDRAEVTVFDGNVADDPRADTAKNLGRVLRGVLLSEGRTIEASAAALIVRRAGGDVSKLRDDVDRLVLFIGDRKHITEDDVMEVSAEHHAIDDEWAVTNALAAGNAAAALLEAGRRLDRGDSVHALVGQLRWWVSNRLVGINEAHARSALDVLLRTDLALKSSGGDERVLLERLVVELAGAGTGSRRLPAR